MERYHRIKFNHIKRLRYFLKKHSFIFLIKPMIQVLTKTGIFLDVSKFLIFGMFIFNKRTSQRISMSFILKLI